MTAELRDRSYYCCSTAFIARHKHPGEAAGSYLAEQGHAWWDRNGDTLRVRIGGEAAVAARGQLFL